MRLTLAGRPSEAPGTLLAVPRRSTLLATYTATTIALGAVALAAIIQIFLAPQFPLPVTVPTSAFWQLPLLAVVMALAAGAIGMRKVLRSDPSQAFSGAA